MGNLARPSEYILRKAWNLGRKMAHKERRIGIDLTFCHQFPSYELFRTTNRARLQNLPAMLIWDERLQFLVQRCVNGLGLSLDNTQHWDVIDQLVTRPIRNAFWTGWEQAMDLRGMYLDAVHAEGARRSLSMLHVNPHAGDASPTAPPHGPGNAPVPSVVENAHPAMRKRPAMAPLQPDVEEENGLWNQVAKLIFDDMAIPDDDAFWAVTGAQIESDHTGDESLDNLPKVFGTIRPTVADVEAPQTETPAGEWRISA